MNSSRRGQLAVAACLGTLTLFAWGAFSHLVLIRGVGFAAIEDERTFLEGTVMTSLAPGLYAFPAPPDWRGEAPTEQGLVAWEQSFREGPAGMHRLRPNARIVVGSIR